MMQVRSVLLSVGKSGFSESLLSFPEPDAFSYSQHARLRQICSTTWTCSKIINRNLHSLAISRSGLHTPSAHCASETRQSLQAPLQLYLSWLMPGTCCAGKALGSWWCSCGMTKLFWCKKWTSPLDILGKEERPHIITGSRTYRSKCTINLEAEIHSHPRSHVLPAGPVCVYDDRTKKKKKTTRKGTAGILDITVNTAVPLYPWGFGSGTTRPQPPPPLAARVLPRWTCRRCQFLKKKEQEQTTRMNVSAQIKRWEVSKKHNNDIRRHDQNHHVNSAWEGVYGGFNSQNRSLDHVKRTSTWLKALSTQLTTHLGVCPSLWTLVWTFGSTLAIKSDGWNAAWPLACFRLHFYHASAPCQVLSPAGTTGNTHGLGTRNTAHLVVQDGIF